MKNDSRTKKRPAPWAALGLLAALAGCGGGGGGIRFTPPAPPQQATTLSCDDNMKTAFKPDAHTTVTLVQAFKAGDALKLANTPATPAPPVAGIDTCLVKLLVGPGNPGPAGAPSTSAGIGIEVWLPKPSAWNKIVRAFGSGGWAGGVHADTTQIGSRAQFIPALNAGYAIGASDHGHALLNNGSFAMNPDGTINTVLWQDFAERSMHEMALKTKALVKAYYGEAQAYAYWDGFSTGGRQGYKIAQKYPADFNGILAGAPAFNWSKFITAELYPQVAMQRELGAPMAAAKLNFASGAAVKACDTLGLGFLLDPLQCRYDPTKDADVLCAGVAGNGVTGASTSASCVSLAEARVINQIWYGQTASGSTPDPAGDNGSGTALGSADHLWWGLTRGTNLAVSLAGSNPFPIATDQVALEFQDPSYAGPSFTNASGNGTSKWKALDYAGLANAYAQGIVLQPQFSSINTDDPNLAGARDAGTKILSYHGLADDKIMPQGSINYFTRVSAAMGGNAEVQTFNRLFLIPGLAHDSTFASSASIDSATGANLAARRVPLPQPAGGRDELFAALRNWVENGVAPTRINLASSDGSVGMPLCLYPQKASYSGSGSLAVANNYECK
ncbi:feruloyl esterase [Variovorax sp. CF079]|uniref:tannase/feruloyl esterase family alpha/beta hydrolase n=1 Tax=Variovorax sp. CF079 TaxID=1882774 RepID=UPI000882F446|nr:tannase/feruloyl esterase family alpha/beta hydrolase [Variovorax sp. CF079]SDE86877.1 feruloyl esterase [Variovorax sp. CF079]